MGKVLLNYLLRVSVVLLSADFIYHYQEKRKLHEIKSKNAPFPIGPYSQGILHGSTIFCSGKKKNI